MNFYLLFILIISLIGIKFFIKDFNTEYLSKKSTNCIKGFFVLLVFFWHFLQYTEPYLTSNYDQFIIFFRKTMRQLVVTLFLFYSGYGVYEGFKKRKEEYVNQMPKNRILKTLFHYDVAILCFLIFNIIVGYEYSIKKIIYAFFAWGSIGNSDWYIFCSLVLYFITFMSLKSFKDKKGVIAIWLQTIIFILFLRLFKDGGYWYNTLLCYPLGMTYSYFKDKIENFIIEKKNNIAYINILGTATVATFVLTFMARKNFWYHEYWAMSFAIFVVFATMKIRVNSPILNWFGENLFWFYILQRMPMRLLVKLGYASSPYIMFIISFTMTVIATAIFGVIFKKVDNIIFKKKEKKEILKIEKSKKELVNNKKRN